MARALALLFLCACGDRSVCSREEARFTISGEAGIDGSVGDWFEADSARPVDLTGEGGLCLGRADLDACTEEGVYGCASITMSDLPLSIAIPGLTFTSLEPLTLEPYRDAAPYSGNPVGHGLWISASGAFRTDGGDEDRLRINLWLDEPDARLFDWDARTLTPMDLTGRLYISGSGTLVSDPLHGTTTLP